MRRALETLVALLLAVPAARAAVMAAPGYAVRTITTPDTVEGGVVREGDAILVGQGPGFTAGAQSIVRLMRAAPPPSPRASTRSAASTWRPTARSTWSTTASRATAAAPPRPATRCTRSRM